MLLDEDRIQSLLQTLQEILDCLGKEKRKYKKHLQKPLPPGGEAMLDLTAPRLGEELKKRGIKHQEFLQDYFRMLQIVHYQKTGGAGEALTRIRSLAGNESIHDASKSVKSLCRGNRLGSFESAELSRKEIEESIRNEISRLESLQKEEKVVIDMLGKIREFLEQ